MCLLGCSRAHACRTGPAVEACHPGLAYMETVPELPGTAPDFRIKCARDSGTRLSRWPHDLRTFLPAADVQRDLGTSRYVPTREPAHDTGVLWGSAPNPMAGSSRVRTYSVLQLALALAQSGPWWFLLGRDSVVGDLPGSPIRRTAVVCN